MKNISEKILSFYDLIIGYSAGRSLKVLLPPLCASACKGELIAVIGKNGIGKSTLLKTLTGLHPAIGGKITVCGKDLAGYSRNESARKIGYTSTEIVKVHNMTVYDLVALGRFPHTNWMGKLNKDDQEAVNEAIEKTGMSDFRNNYIMQLSDGERQRAMIARVLAQNTDILIMDEPTAFLDISSKFEIIHLLHELTSTSGRTIIFSTHDLQTAITRADKIWMILENSLQEGAPEDLVLDGTFNRLFGNSYIKFNNADGSFIINAEQKGTVTVRGEGIRKHWTENAMIRSGFTLSSDGSEPVITVKSSSWTLETGKNTFEFNTIYELARTITSDILRSP
jgi:iron complex transport system ATP-binding protein